MKGSWREQIISIIVLPEAHLYQGKRKLYF